ncbi:sulfite exporter TauE/SafE family protein [Neorhizobium lilium]|uniref:Probable membrane transporter protein n=1 Tax=Neorhizobium lilium TaxID=2503024 RepID=A0A444LBP1_9HYPH|nr:sulfite exporter TauE/SafE family protein [Neorhizobium lilium]RWX75102.1 sulfite exporter TauE/SafE family protein [Neorhizobium lilium]
MTIPMIVLLAVAGFLSGAVNAIAGGGTFLTFGAMTLAGLPPISANATSSIVQFPGYVTSTLAYRDEISTHWRSCVVLGIVSIFGALVGSLILLSLDNPSFRALVPWLLAAATAIFAAGPWLKPKATDEHEEKSVASIIAQFLNAIYGGFFGAGMGIMMLAVLGLTTRGSYHQLNAMKNLFAMLIAAVAIVVFISGGVVAWPQALVMIPAGAAGGYSGVWMARRVPQAVLRWCVVAVGTALTIYYFVTA